VAEFAALIPALDCEATIGAVVRGTLAHLSRVLVVDDGSRDRTADAAKAAGAEVLRQPSNRGKGAALRAGLRALSERGATHALTLDGDGQHLPEEIPLLLHASAEAPGALVLGARQHPPGSLPGIRVFGNRFANRWVRIACGKQLPDTQSGFRVYPIDDTLALGCRARRFAFETEVVIRAARAGLPIRSVPVRVHNPPRGEGTSHFRGFSDTLRIVLTVIGLLLRIR
jgi:glycosyltransferase involved in cell wall biosynthesis